MQFILTQEEYKNLIGIKQKKSDDDKKKLQDFCTMVADNLPIQFWGNEEKRIWGCILSKGNYNYGYCDKCPSQEICPYENKEWSK